MRNGKREKYNIPIIHSANNFKYVLLIIITTIIEYSLICTTVPSMHRGNVGETTLKLVKQPRYS